MKRGVITFFVVCFCILLETLLGSAKAASEGGEVFYFSFRAGSDVYENAFDANRSTFQRLSDCLDKADLSGGDWYLHLEVFVEDREEGRLQMLNQKLFRAAVMRSQLKSGLDVPYDRIAFNMNRYDGFTDVVRVTLIEQPMPACANRDIFYSLSSLSVDISRALARYDQLPFNMQEQYEQQPYEQQPAFVAEVSQPQASEPALDEPQPVRNEPVSSRSAAAAVSKRLPPGAYPFNMAIKTNLLPWMGVVPVWGIDGNSSSDYSNGAPMYNGALEYFFADRYSVEASFLYAYAPYGGNKSSLWGISSFALAPRFWLNPDNSYRKLHIGMRAEYGDFDIKNNKPANYGKTGRFYSVAFAIGYALPIYRNFLFEAGLTLGYRNIYDGKSYRYDPIEQKNYYEEGFAQGQFVVGASIGLMYRLGFW